MCRLALVMVLMGLIVPPAGAAEGEPTVDFLPPGAAHRLGVIRRTVKGEVSGVAFAPDGRRLAACCGEACLHVWDLPRGAAQTFATGREHPVHCLTFSPDGLVLAAGDSDAVVELRDLPTGGLDRELRGHGSTVAALAFAPDGRALASAAEDGEVFLWNRRGRLLRRLRAHRGEVRALAFSADGSTLATGGSDGTIRLWNPAEGKVRRTLATGGPGVSALALSADGKSVLAESAGHVLRRWDAETGREVAAFRGHTAAVRALVLAPDGKALASAGADGTLRLWRLADGAELNRLPLPHGRAAALAFAPDGRALACGGADGVVDLWPLDADGQRRRLAVRLPAGHRSAVLSLTVSADGREVRSGADGESIRWHIPTGTLLEHAAARGRPPAPGRGPWRSADGKFSVARGKKPGTVRVVETLSNQYVCELHGHIADVTCSAFTHDGRTLLTGSEDASILVWDLPTCFLRTPPGPGLIGKRAEAWWEEVGGLDGRDGLRALAVLATIPDRALTALRSRVPPRPDDQGLRQLLTDLDSDTFAVREKASRELARRGEHAAGALRRALTDRPTLEVRRRVEELLANLEPKDVAVRRWKRAVLFLEWQGSVKAREILERLANSSADVEAAQDARAALVRLDGRTKDR